MKQNPQVMHVIAERINNGTFVHSDSIVKCSYKVSKTKCF